MSRSVKEWVGKNDDTPVPPHVRLRVFKAKGEKCHACTKKVLTGEPWICEHLIALINWLPTEALPHGNRESNLGVTCCNCLPEKNATDVAEKSMVYRMAAKNAGIRLKRSKRMPFGRDSGLKRKMDGSIVLRNPREAIS